MCDVMWYQYLQLCRPTIITKCKTTIMQIIVSGLYTKLSGGELLLKCVMHPMSDKTILYSNERL